MAKTGGKAQFKMGESGGGSILLPTKFTTARSAAAQGKRFSNLVEAYASKAEKINDANDVNVAQTIDLDKSSDAISDVGYATRAEATEGPHPLFNGDTLHLTDEETEQLKRDLDLAQDNGNVLHEMAFSMRGDWLAENHLYNPETREIDQDKLKMAEQSIVPDLVNKGFPLPLGEGNDDVVWFGVIHQDTDHLNMHIWFAKKSEEKRPEMLRQDGEPIGMMNFKAKKQAEAKFRNELEENGNKVERVQIMERVDTRRQSIKSDALDLLESKPKYYADLKRVFDALPKDLQGRWKVGNTDSLVTNSTSRMAPANREMNKLIDKLLNNELREDYADFKSDLGDVDTMMEKTHGEQHKGQKTWSEARDNRLRKELANGIYRQFNTNFKPEDIQLNDPKQDAGIVNGRDPVKPANNDNSKFKSFNVSNKNGDIKNWSGSDQQLEWTQHKPYTKGATSPIQTHHALSRMSNKIVADTRKEMQQTKAFLRDKEREGKQSTRGPEEKRDYVPNADVKPASFEF